MVLDEPGPLLGVRLTFLEDAPWSGGRPLSPAERAYREETRRWEAEEEYGYGPHPGHQAADAGLRAERLSCRTGGVLNEQVSEGTPPREWAERLYDLRRWTVMPRGGHFAALEQPRLLAEDIAAFFGELC
jgi:pimeloyl-ACP methyl ester carboxylesterase